MEYAEASYAEAKKSEDPIFILRHLKGIVDAYGLLKRKLPAGRNIGKDIEYVKHIIRQFAKPNQITKFKSVHVLKKGKPLRVKRKAKLCPGVGCMKQISESDLNNLEVKAKELMEKLKGEYSHVLSNLHTIDEKLLSNNSQQ